MDDSRWSSLTSALGCQLGSMPFTYLGLPLGTTRPNVQDFMPILTRMEKHLMGLSRFLSFAGRLVLVNSIFSVVPTLYLCTPKLQAKIISQIDNYRKHVLCHGGDLTKKGGYLVSWKHACRSKEDGGLGIVNLGTQNIALLLKFLHKFYNKLGLPWVSPTWSCLYKNGTPS